MSEVLIRVNPAELPIIFHAIGRIIEPEPVKSARKPAAEPFAPDTGDARLDAFMRAHHDPRWKAPAAPRATAPSLRLPTGSRIGSMVEHPHLGECQVVGQSSAPGAWHVTNGRETATVKLFDRHERVIA